MDIFDWNSLTEMKNKITSPCACTIGVFDGVHLGHKKLIELITERSSLNSTVFTFRENPLKTISPEKFMGNITDVSEKLSLFSNLGVNTVVLIDFSHEFSKLQCNDFFIHLLNIIKIDYLALGENFRCGANANTDIKGVQQFFSEQSCTTFDIVKKVKLKDMTISSTRIRENILQGKMKEAAEMLGRPYRLQIPGWLGKSENSVLILTKKEINKILPPPGKYSVRYKNNEREATGTVLITDKEVVFKQLNAAGEGYIDFIKRLDG